jgi:pyruvate/2-oxoglutarate dehydrogenase complex dihydrolipoamide acyltransferase (E2) component
MSTMEVRVPDIGDFKDVPVIEVLVKAGDRVKKNDSLITLESEKASMEVPAGADGVVQDVKVKVGDRVSEGSTIVTLSAEGAAPQAEAPAPTPQPPPRPAPGPPPDRRSADLRVSSAWICVVCGEAVPTGASPAKMSRVT